MQADRAPNALALHVADGYHTNTIRIKPQNSAVQTDQTVSLFVI